MKFGFCHRILDISGQDLLRLFFELRLKYLQKTETSKPLQGVSIETFKFVIR